MLNSKKSSSTIFKFLSIVAFIGIFCSFTLKSYTVTSIDSFNQNGIVDTLPDISKMVHIDTISVFNPVTKKETINIVKNYSNDIEEYLNKIDYSGNMITATDTVYTLDYDTYEEKVSIVNWEYPVEISELLKKADYGDWNFIIESAKKAMKK